MFDWNDEELANIIWGEAGESDDHIVPYPESSEDLSSKKEWNQEAAVTKFTEQKRSEAKTHFIERKLESSSNLGNNGGLPASGYGKNSWPDLSVSSEAKVDQCSLGTEVSKKISELSTLSSSRGEVSIQLGKGAEIFQNAHEGKEQGDFVDYSWDNIGIFDDLDRIFSNDDPIFGDVSLDNSDELWSSKDASNGETPISLDSPSPSGALRKRTEHLEIKECFQHNDQSFALSYEKIDDLAYQDIQNAHPVTVDVGCTGGRSKPTGKEQKSFRQKNLLKARKKSQVKQGKLVQDFYCNWSHSTTRAGQFENQLVPSVIQSSPSSVIGKQNQLQGPQTPYHNIMNPYVSSSVYGNFTNTHPALPMLSQSQSRDLRCQPLLSGYEESPGLMNPMHKCVDSIKPQTMTPQEKIEKLRRRQQMQALLAIQKQQQQLGHQVPSTNKSITQKCSPEIQSHLIDGSHPEIEELRSLPALDLPIEQDDSNTISVAIDNDFVEDTILYRLQDIISKLDIKIRLCIRDSLFRLAQSAMQRRYASYTNKSSGELEVVSRGESNSHNRYARMPHAETETNPIDRTVAHLLFHRPMELIGNYSDKVQYESKAPNPVNFPVRCLPNEDLKNSQQFSHLGFKNSWSLFEAQSIDQIKKQSLHRHF